MACQKMSMVVILGRSLDLLGSVRGGGGKSGIGRGVGLGWPSDLAARVEVAGFRWWAVG